MRQKTRKCFLAYFSGTIIIQQIMVKHMTFFNYFFKRKGCVYKLEYLLKFSENHISVKERLNWEES